MMALRLWFSLTIGTLCVSAIPSTSPAQVQLGSARLGLDRQSSFGLLKPGSDRDELFNISGLSLDQSDAAAASQNTGLSFSYAGSNDIWLSGYQQKVVASPPGSTITLNLQNFVLTGHSTLSLAGDATSTFIINVANQFSLSQRSRIVLSGGLQWNQVFFNILGTGSTVSLSGRSGLFGILTASQRKVRMTGHALVYGGVFASRVVLRQAAQIATSPTVSE
jgi:hypothetical protein